MEPIWLTAFVDLAPEAHTSGAAFWQGATGSQLSASRGAQDEFATLLPPTGDPWLRVQRVSSQSGTHVDLHVTDLDAAVADALAAGASLVARPGHAVLRSPAGYPFCLVTSRLSVMPEPVAWPDGHLSRVDQLCLDIPAADYDAEVGFWHALTGWPTTPNVTLTEFTRLETPSTVALRILLQRIGEGTIGGHLDVATTDPPAEIARLERLGARVVGEGHGWTVLASPVDTALCVTERDPVTGAGR
jgi:hypothetical protein